MPRKTVIVVVGVILAILALSFFAVGYDLGDQPLVVHEEKIKTSNVDRFFDRDNYTFWYDSTNNTVLLVNRSSLHREPVPTFEERPENVSPSYIALGVLREYLKGSEWKYEGRYIVLPKEIADSFYLSHGGWIYVQETVELHWKDTPRWEYTEARTSLDGRFRLIWDLRDQTYILEYSIEPLIPLPTYDVWSDASRNCSPDSSIETYAVGAKGKYVITPNEYMRTYPRYVTKKTGHWYQGDFYLLSMLCLIGLCFLAMYAAFTSRRE